MAAESTLHVPLFTMPFTPSNTSFSYLHGVIGKIGIIDNVSTKRTEHPSERNRITANILIYETTTLKIN